MARDPTRRAELLRTREGRRYDPLRMSDRDEVDALLRHRRDDVVGQRELLAALRRRLFERPTAPTRIGRYEVRERIGRGAQGIVYRAFDPRLRRDVAIKVLDPPVLASDGESLARRLRQEARALARVSHPNVLPVYDVGEAEHGVFIAMELVHGVDLRRWQEAESRSRTELLDVFASAAAGLQAAHEQGLVHRDFKPANVLIGEGGRVYVSDFGLAQLASSTGSTEDSETRTVVGTPRYMPPEQADGREVGPAADQFSFCVALVEALTGRAPSEDRRTLRAQLAGLPRRLRVALLRGLEAEASDRWPDMASLVAASRPRRRALPLLASVALGLLAAVALWPAGDRGSSCGETPQLDAMWNPDRKATIERAFSASGVAYAADAHERVAARVDDFVGQWRSAERDRCAAHRPPDPCLVAQASELDDLLGVFERADAEVVRHATTSVRALPLPDTCRERSFSSVDPQWQARLREIKALEAAGRRGQAIERAQTLADDAEAASNTGVQAQALLRKGRIMMMHGTAADAAAPLEAAAWKAIDAKDDLTAAWAMTWLVVVVGHIGGDLEAGLVWARHAASAIARLGGAADIEAARLDNLGILYLDAGQLERAAEYHRRAIELTEERLGPDDPLLSQFLLGLGNVTFYQGDLEAARTHYGRALQIRREAFGPKHPSVASPVFNLGNVHLSLGNLDEAEAAYRESLAIEQSSHVAGGAEVAMSVASLANVAAARGQYEAARSQYERVLEMWEALGRGEGAWAQQARTNLANALSNLDRHDEAIEMFRRAIRGIEAAGGPTHPQLVEPLNGLASALSEVGRTEEAKELYARAIDVSQTAVGHDDARVAASLADLAALKQQTGDADGALADVLAAFEIERGLSPPGDQIAGPTSESIAQTLRALGRHEDAADAARRAAAAYATAGRNEDAERMRALLHSVERSP